MSNVFHGNINLITEENSYFRDVIATTTTMQLVVMSIEPNDEIGTETHEYTTQFIRVEKGSGICITNDETFVLEEGSSILIPPETQHNIINTSSTEPLKLYTLYSPPNHPKNRFDPVKPNFELSE